MKIYLRNLSFIIFAVAIITEMASIADLATGAIDATYSCADKRCLEGTPINYTISVTNNLNKTIQILLVSIVDVNTQQLISSYRLEKSLNPSEDYTITYEDTIISPKEGYTFQYKPCIQVSVLNADSSVDNSGIVCDRVIKSLTVLPLSKIECEADWQCSNNQFCDNKFYRCKDLECENYTFPLMHECTSYNALWAIIGIIIVIALGAFIYIRSKYRVYKYKPKSRAKVKGELKHGER